MPRAYRRGRRVNDVRGTGVDADGGNAELLNVGHKVCRMLSEGQTRSEIAVSLTYDSGKSQGTEGINRNKLIR